MSASDFPSDLQLADPEDSLFTDLLWGPSSWELDNDTSKFSQFLTPNYGTIDFSQLLTTDIMDESWSTSLLAENSSASLSVNQEFQGLDSDPKSLLTTVGINDAIQVHGVPVDIGLQDSARLTAFNQWNSYPFDVEDPMNASWISMHNSAIPNSTQVTKSLQTFSLPIVSRAVKRVNAELEEPGEEQAVIRTISTKKTKARKTHGEALPGRHCFRLGSDAPTHQHHAKYSSARSREVQQLRITGGACISCRVVKKQVSLKNSV
jgi:hypothetical protein